jgi:hypothetical protein
MTDYDAARAKMKRLVDKPAEDTTKLPRVSYYHFVVELQLTNRRSRNTMKLEISSTSSTTSSSLNYLNLLIFVFVRPIPYTTSESKC